MRAALFIIIVTLAGSVRKHVRQDPKCCRLSPASSSESLLSDSSSSGYHRHDKRNQGDEEDEISVVSLDDEKCN
jgi:hypothetical protein